MDYLAGAFLISSFICLFVSTQIVFIVIVVGLMKPKLPKRRIKYDQFKEDQD